MEHLYCTFFGVYLTQKAFQNTTFIHPHPHVRAGLEEAPHAVRFSRVQHYQLAGQTLVGPVLPHTYWKMCNKRDPCICSLFKKTKNNKNKQQMCVFEEGVDGVDT